MPYILAGALLLISAGGGNDILIAPEPEYIEITIVTLEGEPPVVRAVTEFEDHLETRSYRVWQPTQYREVLPEDKNPISFVNPPPLSSKFWCPDVIEAGNENLPIYITVGIENVDLFRITTCEIWEVGGGSLPAVIAQESDALAMTRVVMGENPHSLNERVYIMWLIRIRAELGYKNAVRRGWNPPADRWWDIPTSIKKEALCMPACQFASASMWFNIYFTASTNNQQLTAMVYPRGQQLIDFLHTYEMAQWILDQPMSNYPDELRGYDEFRASSIAGEGAYYREGGLPSRIMFREGSSWNVFRDVSPWDNVFFQNLETNIDLSYWCNARVLRAIIATC